MSNTALKTVAPIAVIVFGVVAAVQLASARRTPERVDRPALGPLVEVAAARATSVPVVVTGHGEVVPSVAVDLVPQVAGQVIGVHRSLVPGGFFRAGEGLVTIDPRDYELALDRAEAAVARALVGLERERAEAEVARSEWDDLHPGEAPPGLVIREPQVRQAEAELAAAEADLAVARLNLERTTLSVPFDGVVVSESVDVGQYVGGASRVARVFGTAAVEVRVPLSSSELEWFDVPSRAGGGGSRAEISTGADGARSVRSGRVTRMEAQVDQSSRMVHVVVEVRDPYDTRDHRTALLPGTFVDVRIFGRELADVVPVPRHAIREGGRVWVYSDGRLEIREVEVVRSDREQALIGSGLAPGELVIVSALDAVTDRMVVRNAADEEKTNDEAPADRAKVSALPGPTRALTDRAAAPAAVQAGESAGA
jgi:RND family efflux transporter MFP subunit